MTDYSRLGLKCGLEIHQQLKTKKLFCGCLSELNDKESEEFVRRLRPTQSEMGEIDKAALEEARRKLLFRYQAPPDTTCLVEADEEPPHEANKEAIHTVLRFAAVVDSVPVDEIHFMRKIVVDGSNTTGFQRTALIANGGHIRVGERRIRLSTICLEEDAARKVERKEGEVTYRLDRLGIPLIEIATEPDIRTPEEARDAALRIGTLLRATKRVMRGIGTIREDLNVSIEGGGESRDKGRAGPWSRLHLCGRGGSKTAEAYRGCGRAGAEERHRCQYRNQGHHSHPREQPIKSNQRRLEEEGEGFGRQTPGIRLSAGKLRG